MQCEQRKAARPLYSELNFITRQKEADPHGASHMSRRKMTAYNVITSGT